MRSFARLCSLTATVVVIAACKTQTPAPPPAPAFDTGRTVKEVTMPGRHMAPAGTKSDNPGSELEPEQIEALVTQDHQAFTKFAFSLQDTAIAALKAIDAKDTEALSSAGGDIDMACESCHTKYWYPNKKAG